MDLIKREFTNDNSNSILKFSIQKLLPSQVPITQIEFYNTGVITLSVTDCSWVEKICRASLITGNEYFSTLNTRLNFHLNYIQSYIIRTYLLLSHIDYEHIIQKYQFYQSRNVNSLEALKDDQETFGLDENYSKPLEIEWNHLNQLSTDKIYHGYDLLKQIAVFIKEKQDDSSSLKFSEFIQSISDNEWIISQLAQYEIKDFKLSHFIHIAKLYRTLIRNFEYPFINIPDLLRAPINPTLNNQLEQIFTSSILNVNYDDVLDKIQLKIEEINQLLNDFKSIENTLLQQSNQSLKQICEGMEIENSILNLIPEEIKCENYVSLCIYFNQIQSNLQERKVNFEEKSKRFWTDNFDSNQDQQNDRFWNRNTAARLNYSRNLSIYEEPDEENTDQSYSRLFSLDINTISIESLRNILRNSHQETSNTQTMKKLQKFNITHPDGTTQALVWKIDKFNEGFLKLFKEKTYDFNTYAIVGSHRISIDITQDDTQQSLPSTEYSIVPKDQLISIEFHYENELFHCSTMPDCRFFSLIDHLPLESTPLNPFYYFHNETGQLIGDQTIGDLSQTNSIQINIYQFHHTSTLFQITFTPTQGKSSTTIFIHL